MLLPLFLGKPVQAMVCPRTVPGLPADGRRVCSEKRRSSFTATVGIGSGRDSRSWLASLPRRCELTVSVRPRHDGRQGGTRTPERYLRKFKWPITRKASGSDISRCDFTRRSSSFCLILVLHPQPPHHFAFVDRAEIINAVLEE